MAVRQARKETTFARAIRRYMDSRGLTQEGFAQLIGVNKGTVSKWLSGQGQRQEMVDLAADRLGMAPWELLMWAEDEVGDSGLPPHLHDAARKLAELPGDRQRTFLQFLDAWSPNDVMNVAVAGASR